MAWGLGHVSVTSLVVEPGAWPRGCGGPGGGGQCSEAGGWGAHGSAPTRCVGQGIQNRGSVPHTYTHTPLGPCAHTPFLSRFRTESHKAFKGQLSSWSCPVGFGERDRGAEGSPLRLQLRRTRAPRNLAICPSPGSPQDAWSPQVPCSGTAHRAAGQKPSPDLTWPAGST